MLICAAILALTATVPIHADEIRYVGDHTVLEDEIVNGDVVVVTGDVIVRGQVNGSVIAYIGDITLESSAVVTGSVIAKAGRVYRNESARISGKIVESWLPDLRIGRDTEPVLAAQTWDDEDEERDWDEWDRWSDWEFNHETDVEASYDKVDGLYLGLSYDRFPFSDYGVRFRSFGSGGYAFASHTWQGKIGFGMYLGANDELGFSLDAYHQTHSEDLWYMSDRENSLAAFFIHEDFRDYYLRKGFGMTLALQPWQPLTLSGRYQAEQHGILETEAEWALFGGHKEFLPNLPIEEGMLREFVFSAEFDTRDDDQAPLEGWWVQAEVELTNPDLASDFDYRRALVDARRYQPLTRYINFDTRLRVGNSEGTLPLQKRFYLGGPSSLPGFGLKSFSGREFALLNTELRFHDEYHGSHWFLLDLSLFVFADVGMATDQSLVDLNTDEWASDVGIGICNDEGNVRLQVAKRTDTSDDPYTIMFRIARPF
jgi:hypothetical protein